MALLEVGQNPGPAALGHDPLILPDARKGLMEAVDSTGIVSIREDPALPWLSTE